MKKNICIFGTGGSGRETFCCLLDILSNQKKQKNICFMISDENYLEKEIMGFPVLKFSEFNIDKHEVVVSIGEPAIRKKIVAQFPEKTIFKTLIHPTAIISDWVKIGEGSIITAGVIITCNIEIGKHTQLNLTSTIGHDCKIGDYFTTAFGVNISGNCTFGNNVYLGSNSTIKQGISICDNVTIGMGAVVTKNIDQPGVYVGSPAKILTK